ncbi:MAG: molecular chaperone DnaJ [Actinomycetota bacterium]
MAATTDLYALLGVERDATQEDIKRAYRKLAREHHPDVSGDARSEDRFKEVTAAYEILSDPAKRRQYDTFGSGTGPLGGQQFGDIGDIFDFFFSGSSPFSGGRAARGRRPSRTQPGEALAADLTLSFEEAIFGVRTDVSVEAYETCATCSGNGCASGTFPSSCRACGGRGEVQAVQQSIFGSVMTMRLCATCQGAGEEVVARCETCGGEGRIPKLRVVTVEVPAGVDDGMELRVTGAGHVGRAGGAPGDLYVRLRVRPHPVFARRGQDLFTLLEVPMTQAVLGAELEIPTLDGTERVKLERGVASGAVIRLKGKGAQHIERRGRGDLFLTVHVSTPEAEGKEERKLLERLAELRGEVTTRSEPARGALRRPDEAG